MAGGLDGDAHAPLPGQAHGGDHVVVRLGEDDGVGALVEREVPRPAGVIPAVVAWRDDLSSDASTKRGGERLGHRNPP